MVLQSYTSDGLHVQVALHASTILFLNVLAYGSEQTIWAHGHVVSGDDQRGAHCDFAWCREPLYPVLQEGVPKSRQMVLPRGYASKQNGISISHCVRIPPIP